MAFELIDKAGMFIDYDKLRQKVEEGFAYRMVVKEGRVANPDFVFKVVGISKYQDNAESVVTGQTGILLRRDHSNSFDKNAISVFSIRAATASNKMYKQLGYVPRGLCVPLAPVMDAIKENGNTMFPMDWFVVTKGGQKPRIGIRIGVKFREIIRDERMIELGRVLRKVRIDKVFPDEWFQKQVVKRKLWY